MLSVVIASRTNVDLTLRCPLVVTLPHGDEQVSELRLSTDDARGLVRHVRDRIASTATPPTPS